MKPLLKKEFCLTALPLSYLFLAFSLMTMIPGYPIAISGFFFCLGLFQSMLSAREAGDLVFTMLLPVSKKDAVSAKYGFTVVMELLFFALCSVFTLIRCLYLADSPVYTENVMMNANPAYLGWIMFLFLAFNVFVLGGFWKDGRSLGLPFLRFSILAAVILILAETLHHLPGWEALNQTIPSPKQWCIFALGCGLYGLISWVSMKQSQKKFEIVDL